MSKFISRLIRAGMPRPVAVCVCRHMLRERGEIALSQYVDAVEAENGDMAAI